MIWMLAAVAIQAMQSMQQTKQQNAMLKIQNQAKESYNKQVMAQAAKAFNEITVQKSALKDQTAQALDATQRQSLAVKSERGLQAAATDTMGASVDQLLLDVDQRTQEAKSTLMYNEAMSDLSLNAAAQQVADSAGSSLQSGTPLSNTWSAALGSAVGAGASMLVSNKLQTGSFMGKDSSGFGWSNVQSGGRATAGAVSRLFGVNS